MLSWLKRVIARFKGVQISALPTKQRAEQLEVGGVPGRLIAPGDLLSPHFLRAEAACRDAKRTAVPLEFLPNAIEVALELETLREALGNVPIKVNSWYRTVQYNKKVGGSPKSQHLSASAVDITAAGVSVAELHKTILALIHEGRMKDGGVGLYPSFVHYDIGPAGRRWNG